MLLQIVSGLTEWQKATLITSMNGSRGRIHLLGEEIPELTEDKFNAAGSA